MARLREAGYIPVATQVITCNNSTAQVLNSTMQVCKSLHVSVETQNARFGFNSTAPTLTTGVLLVKELAPYLLDGVDAANIKFQRTTGTAKITVQGYKRPGDQ